MEEDDPLAEEELHAKLSRNQDHQRRDQGTSHRSGKFPSHPTDSRSRGVVWQTGVVDRGSLDASKGWQDGWHANKDQKHDGGGFRLVAFRGDHKGGFGGRGGSMHSDKDRSSSKWEDAVNTGKGEDHPKPWGDIGPNTRVLRVEDKGICFRCLQSGHHQARCTNPPACYKCKKIGHTGSSCPDDNKQHGLKLFGFGVPGKGFYQVQVPGMQTEQQSAIGIIHIKEGVASVTKLEAELKHLIQENWDWKVKRLSTSAILFFLFSPQQNLDQLKL